jgi:predicted transposase YbfD/YdcC
VRRLRTTTRLNGYLDWPGVAQVCLIERTRRIRGQTTTETVAAITSLTPEQAGAADLLRIARDHWRIENRLHWVRDMSLGEDACRVRTGAAPQILAALRNAGLSLLRALDVENIAAALRRHAARPLEAIQMVLQGCLPDL